MIINDNGTDREMTETEKAAYLESAEKILAHIKTQEKAQADKAKQKQAVLDRLEITADEAALLLG